MAFEQVRIRLADGQEFGPVAWSEMLRWRQEGRVPPDALIVDHATGEAQPLVAVPALAQRPSPVAQSPLVPPPPPSPIAAASNLKPAGQGSLPIVCLQCGNIIVTEPRRTFLGFLRYHCDYCATPSVYPLTSGYRIAYIIIGVWLSLVMILSLLAGRIAIPGVLGVAAVVGIISDEIIRRKVKTMRERSGFH